MAFEQYWFLFALAFLWIVFAVVQDLRKTEISNWLNFSLVAIALAYRAFYSSFFGNWEFLWFGFLGVLIFVAMGNLFYYSRAFGGGDAKLLFGIGAVLPFESYLDLLILGIGFIFVLFFVGAIYSLIYGLFIAFGNWEKFRKEFVRAFLRYRHGVYFAVFVAFVLSILLKFYFILIFIGLLLVLIYLVAVDKCMINFVKPKNLMEGDWLVSDIAIGRQKIRKSVHGLSLEQIKMLKKARKSVLIKAGVPFAPAFLIAFVIMVYAFLVLRFQFLAFLF